MSALAYNSAVTVMDGRWSTPQMLWTAVSRASHHTRGMVGALTCHDDIGPPTAWPVGTQSWNLKVIQLFLYPSGVEQIHNFIFGSYELKLANY